MNGFLHFGGTPAADLNLAVQVTLAVAMAMGAICARRRHYRVHGIIEASVVLCGLVMTGAVMVPSFPRRVFTKAPTLLRRPYYAVVMVHALLGAAAEVLALYVILSAATDLLPARLRLQNYKLGMRATLVLWWIALASGVAVYYVWYIASPR
jgi:uncharacterized membrane protein YozB (DUF420 family)